MRNHAELRKIEAATWISDGTLIIRHGGGWGFRFFGLFLLVSFVALGLPLLLFPPDRNTELAMVAAPAFILLGLVSGYCSWNWRMIRVFDRDRRMLNFGWSFFRAVPQTELPFSAIEEVTVAEVPTRGYGSRYVVQLQVRTDGQEATLYLHEFSNNPERANNFASVVQSYLDESNSVQ
jgi:hypothetical protein